MGDSGTYWNRWDAHVPDERMPCKFWSRRKEMAGLIQDVFERFFGVRRKLKKQSDSRCLFLCLGDYASYRNSQVSAWLRHRDSSMRWVEDLP